MEVVVFGNILAGFSPDSSSPIPAGKAALQALAAARLGCAATLVGRVGRDSAGKALLETFRAEGVEVSHVVEDPQAPTGTVTLVPGPDGPVRTVAAGANARLGIGDAGRAGALLEPGAFLLLQLEAPIETVVHSASIGRNRGACTVLDAAPVRPLPQPLWRYLDLMVVCAAAAEIVVGLAVRDLESARAAAIRIRQRGPSIAVVTIGADGAVLDDGANAVHAPAPAGAAVDKDTVEDAFVAGLVARLLRKGGPADALAFAVASGAATGRRRGSPPALPFAADVEAVLRPS